MGTSSWAAGAGSARLTVAERLLVAARVDYFREWTATGAAGAATPIFWAGARWITSQTATIDLRPARNLSVRLEYRHDVSERNLFFQGNVQRDATGQDQPSARTQDTLTLGAVAWF